MPCPWFGNYPAEYNRAVHGPYLPWRYYGKPDTPFGELKLSEVRPWLARRNFKPTAMAAALSRALHRYNWRFYTPKYSSVLGLVHFAAGVILWSYLINWKTIRHHKNRKYHW